MSTLISRLRTTDDLAPVQHQRINAPPPSPGVEIEEDVTTGVNEDDSDDNEPVLARKGDSKAKGKGVDPRERSGGSSDRNSTNGLVDEIEDDDRNVTRLESYPPMDDETIEAKRVEENLRHLELMEKQRRKAARDSRSARTPSSIVSDVASFVTTFRRDSKTSFRNSGWTPARTRDSQDMGKGDPLQPTRGTSEDASTSIPEETVHRNPFSDAQQAVDNEAQIPTPPSEDPPIRPPIKLTRESSSPSLTPSDPFKNPDYETANKTDLDVPLLSTTPNISPSASPKTMTLQVPSLTKTKDNKRTKSVPPLVRPLDLPEPKMPRMEPSPGTGHWRRVQESRQRDLDLMEEMDRDQKEGRWWTDWLCGCREVSKREDQDGRTNPFE